jgi:hypothetical protein
MTQSVIQKLSIKLLSTVKVKATGSQVQQMLVGPEMRQISTKLKK